MRAPGRRFPLLPRKKRSDKSAYGHALIVAGSRRMTGAAVLAATAALRSGAGLVTVAAPEGIVPVLQKKLPSEIMALPLPQTRAGSIAVRAASAVSAFVSRRRVNVLAVGPGLGTDSETARLVRTLVAKVSSETVLDADGLNAFRGHADALGEGKGTLVLTPHAREFTRLFAGRVPEETGVRVRLAKQTAGRYHGVLVLKGHRTVVAERGRFFVNSTGNPGLAKGGAGDVLTGMIAAFLAQGLKPFEAAAWAVYFHGRAADLAVKRTGELGLTAGDVIEFLPKAFAR